MTTPSKAARARVDELCGSVNVPVGVRTRFAQALDEARDAALEDAGARCDFLQSEMYVEHSEAWHACGECAEQIRNLKTAKGGGDAV